MNSNTFGKFYVCAAPVGNLGDITLRALEVLKQADYIACEDTRVTKVLLDKYNISAKLLSCHKFNEKEASSKIIELIKNGYTAVYLSDAGTPLISDPGGILIKELQKNGIKITALPGACAVSILLSMLPRDNEEYAFIGFIPREKKQQIDILNKYKAVNCVFYESPLRLLKTLENIKSEYGAETKISIGRELTKLHEEVITGAAAEIIEYYSRHVLKGEITAVIYAHAENSLEENTMQEKIKLLKQAGYSAKDAAKILQLLYGWNKNKVYQAALSGQ